MPKEQTKAVPAAALILGSIPLDLVNSEGQDPKRTFSGVVNSGNVMDHPYWGRFIIDMASIDHNAAVPGLIDHNPEKRAAVGKLSTETGKLIATGNLLSNKWGQQVADDADDGFPWQMSPRVRPSSIEELKAGASAEVNGKKRQGPLTIFRGTRVSEFSFTPVGVDESTSASVLSDSQPTINVEVRMAQDHTPAAEELQARIRGYEQQVPALIQERDAAIQQRDEARSQLSALTAELRADQVSAYLSAKGVETTDENMKPYVEMSAEVWEAIRTEGESFLSRNTPENPGQPLPPEFFSRERRSDEALSSRGNPVVENAKARAQA